MCGINCNLCAWYMNEKGKRNTSTEHTFCLWKTGGYFCLIMWESIFLFNFKVFWFITVCLLSQWWLDSFWVLFWGVWYFYHFWNSFGENSVEVSPWWELASIHTQRWVLGGEYPLWEKSCLLLTQPELQSWYYRSRTLLPWTVIVAITMRRKI